MLAKALGMQTPLREQFVMVFLGRYSSTEAVNVQYRSKHRQHGIDGTQVVRAGTYLRKRTLLVPLMLSPML
jgi:hypothetical protein